MKTGLGNSNRIAKNTLILYMRTFFIMIVSLYTSRVILNTLGVENYGIYNVVAGFVSMLSILSGSLSSAVSRFITIELGKGNIEKLKLTFSISIIIQLMISLVVIILAETLGLWFVNTQMNIPNDRIIATNWVYQFSVLIFVTNLLNVPLNATIIAHEKMSAFAYVSIIDVLLKLMIAFAIQVVGSDKLIIYSLLLFVQSLITSIIYIVYCRLKFEECKFKIIFDRGLFKEMTGFAGWAFLTSGFAVINTQGITVLINIFFGVALNAARGIATQVESILMKFVNDFTTAIKPQIIKSYAINDKKSLENLVYRGAKFSYYLLLILSLPLVFETEFVLHLWLGIVPDHTISFFRLTIIASMINVLGNTAVTACLATGNIKKYTITLTTIGLFVFPLTWLAFFCGFPVETCYIIYIIIYTIIFIIRLFLMRELIQLSIIGFYKNVIVPVIFSSTIVLIFPYIVFNFLEPSIIRFIICSISCIISALVVIYYIGLTKEEKKYIREKIFKRKI